MPVHLLKLQFQDRPWDIMVLLIYSLLVSIAIILQGHGTIVALILVLFAPGYLLVAIVFPRKGEIEWSERIALSIFFSIVFVPILGIALNLSPTGMAFYPSTLGLTIMVVLTGVAAFWRRVRLPVTQRLSAAVVIAMPAWKEFTITDKATTLALASAIVVATVALATVLKPVEVNHHFTQFFLLGPGGTAAGYPTKLNISEAGRVIVGIANHESLTTSYLVRVDLVGVISVYNVTIGFNESIDVNRTTLSWLNATLGDGQSWNQPYSFSINSSSLWKVQFLLFRNGDNSSPYRELHLYVRVD